MEDKVTTSKIGMKYGFIGAIVLIIYGLILQISGLAGNQALGYLNLLFLGVIIVLAHNAFKSGGDGYMSLGQGIGIGVLISVVSGVGSSIFSYIYIKFIDDSMLQMARDKALENLEAKGMSEDQIEQAMSWTEKFTTPLMILIFGIIFTVFFGFILSLLISLFTKKSNPEAAV